MKKILSLILALTMVSTLVMALFVSVSAKDGDLLWEADFKNTTDSFNPELFAQDDTNKDNVPAVSADGKSIEWTFGTTEKGRYRWGDTLDDLKVTADTKYTIDVVYKAQSDKSNGGLAFVAGGTLDKVKAGEAGWCTLYGRTNSTFSFYRTEESNYSKSGWKDHYGVKDADGYVTFKIEVYGYNIRIYTKQADGSFKHAFSYAVPGPDRENAVLACGIYTWVNVDYVDVVGIKSFKVTQGCALTDEILKTKLTDGLASTYKAAKNGALIYSANFNGDDYFKPVLGKTNDKRVNGNTIEASADGKSLAFKGHTYGTSESSVGAAVWYGSPIKGLDVTADTEYTVEFKVKNDADYGGAIFYATPDVLPGSYVSFYGALNSSSSKWTVAKGSETAAHTFYGQTGNAYVAFDERVLDADGYYDVKVEIDGYNVTVYCKAADGYKKLENFIMDDVNAVLAAGVYNYQSKAATFVKDYNVYKGLTVTNDYSKVTEAPETQAPTTTPVTPSNPNTGDNTVISIIVAAIAVTALGAVVVTKKDRA
jgi:hypothetical protein